jgi:hypothetical protein
VGATENELRRQAGEQRHEMGDTLEAIGDRLSPERVIERRKAVVGQRFRRVKDTVMGSPEYQEPMTQQVRERTGGMMQSATEAVRSAPSTLADQARGNPIAVGVVAFGAGLLLATVMPKSETESRLMEEAQPQVQSAMSELKEAGRDITSDAQEHARAAGEELKGAGSEAASHVKDQAQASADEVKGTAS